MIVNHNMSAINANRFVKFNDWATQKSIGALASGMRINSAADDATGLAVSERMRTQVRGLRQAERNTEDGISFVQTAEGYMDQTTEMLQRIRQLAVQAANGIYSPEDRALIQVEVSQLVDEVDRIASQAQFNKMPLLNGAFAKEGQGNTEGVKMSMWFHMGPNQHQRESVYIRTMTASALQLKNADTKKAVSISTPTGANEVIGKVDAALTRVLRERGNLGAYGNRLEMAAKGLMNAYENTVASESRIRDTDMAEAMVEYTKNSILTEASSIMLSHANLRPQTVLKLLNG